MIRVAACSWTTLLFFALFMACSSEPYITRPDGLQADGSDAQPGTDAAEPDSAEPECTPGAIDMCDDDSTMHCVDRQCVPCPAGRVDCDRKDACECRGACASGRCLGEVV